LAARPLAGLADVYVWRLFFPVMIVGAGLVSAMYAASACLFRRVFRRHFGTGCAFLAVYALLPLGIEGTYWMSASTRIVTGLFFAALALWAFERWCSGEKPVWAIVYAVCQLLSYGFYEQLIPFSAASVLLLAIISRKISVKRRLISLWSFVAAGIYFAFVTVFHESALYGSKTGYILPRSQYYFDTFLPEVFSQLKSAFLGGGFYTLTRAGVRGLSMIAEKGLWLYALVILLLCVALFLFARRHGETKNERPAAALIVGALLIIAPLAPFFVAETTWFSFRGTVCSFCGIALMADTLLRLIFSRPKWGRSAAAAVTAVFALWCCVCSVSEMSDYKQTTEKDAQVCRAIETALRRDKNVAAELSIGVLNVSPSYLPEQNSYYHEHIHGVTESGWALSGAMGYYMDFQPLPKVTPVPVGRYYAAWNRDAMQLLSFDVLYLYDGEDTLTNVTALEQEDGSFLIVDGSGEVRAFAFEQDGKGYLGLSSPTEESTAPS
ncbi:MAG: glucosyltransferase domain-containing protein, partial [Oscillospiraceae bacterium]|nr:glucosyltransferase domain-containing protein [Oscillospiraceae bacterium]